MWTASNQQQSIRMLDVLRSRLPVATRVDVAVSFLRCSGLGLLVEDIRKFRRRGGRLRFLTSTYLGLTQPEAMAALVELVPLEDVKVFDHQMRCFHMKLYIFDGTDAECWVGSSNLTKGGLTSNFELNLCHRDLAAIKAINADFEMAWTDQASVTISPAFIESYKSWREKLQPSPRTGGPAWPRHELGDSGDPDESHGAASKTFQSVSQETSGHTRTAAHEGPNLRPNEAQREALALLADLRSRGESRAVVIAAPGVGKTFLAAFDARVAGARHVLFVSHRLEHLRQARDAFQRLLPGLSTGLIDANHDEGSADLVFSTVQALRSRSWNRPWDYVVIDEFHHADAASYRSLFDSLNAGFILGITATPERQDGHNVLQLCHHNIAYEIRLPEAINRQLIIPFHYFAVSDDVVQYSNIPWRSGRFDPEELETALLIEARVDLVLRHAREKGFDGLRRATVGFCAGRRHAKFMAESFMKRGLTAAYLTGEDSYDVRQQTYEQFSDPKHPLEWLFVADLLNEGVDIPAINSLLFLRPTESATIFIQQLGRGLRLHPSCKVLTAIDFVGHHQKAWLTFKALDDPHALPNPSTLTGLPISITPPRNCELVLDDRTREILHKVNAVGGRRRDQCIDAYRKLRDELGTPPYPVDFIARRDMPDFSEFRSVFGTWMNLRKEMNDAEDWEVNLASDHPLYELLQACERDWQAPRVTPYAMLWGSVQNPDKPETGYYAFFDKYPRWRDEQVDPKRTNVMESLTKKLESAWSSSGLDPRIFQQVSPARLLSEVESRIQLVLERDYMSRHGGVLRTPEELSLWTRYSRSQAVNHFGLQYDPARHNTGVITFDEDAPFPGHIVIITKLDTSGAKATFQYKNVFRDESTFQWQSQNQNSPESEPGRRIVRAGLATLHLFVQERSHVEPVYCGVVEATRHESRNPINVWFHLGVAIPQRLNETFGLSPGNPETGLLEGRRSVSKSGHSWSDRPALALVESPPADLRFVEFVPYYDLQAAAGSFNEGRAVPEEAEGWIHVPSTRLSSDMFALKVVGRSMEPSIADGSIVLFRFTASARAGDIVLAQYGTDLDPDTGYSLVVKQYRVDDTFDSHDPQTSVRIELASLNPAFPSIRVIGSEVERLRVIGTLVKVIH